MKRRVYIIGAGGVGSWLTPSLCLLIGPGQVAVMDGDKLEEGNLNRQLFTKGNIGRNKALALAEKYSCGGMPYFYSTDIVQHEPTDFVICCGDNHPVRREILETADSYQCHAIIACNETHSAEALYYNHVWKGSDLDPRVYYPEIQTSDTGDPRRARIGCTGTAQEQTPQLVSANFMAAALAQHLFVLWAMEAEKLDQETFKALPFRLNANLSSLTCVKCGDVTKNKNV
jgi:hypothetical protein